MTEVNTKLNQVDAYKTRVTVFVTKTEGKLVGKRKDKQPNLTELWKLKIFAMLSKNESKPSLSSP